MRLILYQSAVTQPAGSCGTLAAIGLVHFPFPTVQLEAPEKLINFGGLRVLGVAQGKDLDHESIHELQSGTFDTCLDGRG